MSFFVSDCPFRDTEWPQLDPVQLSPEKIEQEKKNRQKKRFLEVFIQKEYLGV